MNTKYSVIVLESFIESFHTLVSEPTTGYIHMNQAFIQLKRLSPLFGTRISFNQFLKFILLVLFCALFAILL